MYYDIVASIMTLNTRTDCHLICGGFASAKNATDYIKSNNIKAENYMKYCNDDQYVSIDIEKHANDGSLIEIILI